MNWISIILLIVIGLCAGCITALSGAIGYALNKHISLLAAILVGAGAIVGGRVGAIYANMVPEKKLAKIVGVIFTMLGVLMIAKQVSLISL